LGVRPIGSLRQKGRSPAWKCRPPLGTVSPALAGDTRASEIEFFIANLLVRIHFIIVMIRWTGLAPWEFEFPFPGSLTSTFLDTRHVPHSGVRRDSWLYANRQSTCATQWAMQEISTLVSLSLRLKDLLGPVTRVKRKKKFRLESGRINHLIRGPLRTVSPRRARI